METNDLLKAFELQLRQNELDNAREERQQNQEQTNNITGAKSSILDCS